MAVGADLRNARIARNRSIDDISRLTKISPSLLAAIETENFDRVPGGLFRRGYLRAYAREVGLDPDAVVQKYRDEFEPPLPAPEPQPQSARLARVTNADAWAGWRPFIELGAIALIAGACFAFVVRSSRPTSTPDAQVAAPPAVAESRNAPPDRSVATSGSTEGVPGEVKIALRATGPCWIEAISGGKRLVARLMNKGDTETVTVRNEVWLRVGDPSMLSYTIDGKMGRQLGPPGKPVRAQIDRHNYREFLVSRQ
jgi:cytoskeletal protein RodZ